MFASYGDGHKACSLKLYLIETHPRRHFGKDNHYNSTTIT